MIKMILKKEGSKEVVLEVNPILKEKYISLGFKEVKPKTTKK